VLRIEQIGIHDNYFELGGDSILSIQIVARAREEGLEITPRQMFQHQSIAALASVAQSTRNSSADQGLVTGPVALTPIQRWFFEQKLANANHYNQSLMLETRDTLDPFIMRAVVEKIIDHHDALRMRFHPRDVGWGQVCIEPGGYAPFTALDLSGLSDIQKRGAIEAAAGQVQGSLDITGGPVIRFVLADLGAGRPGRLLITAHHLVMDAVSWAILLEDLLAAYEQLRAGKQISLPRKTTSYKTWSE
jgi:aryl carrier-like protein